MAADQLASVVAAVNVIYDPLRTNTERHAAQEFCDSFKLSASPAYGLHLAHCRNQYNEMVRHFGLHLLEHIIKTQWQAGSEAEKQQIKDAVLDLMREGMYDVLTEKLFLKEKLCQLVVEMAKRDWPQRWPQLMDQLLALLRMGPGQAELVLLTLRTLSEDVINGAGEIPDARRNDLVTGLTATVDFVLPVVLQLLVQSAQSSSDPTYEKLALASLKALATQSEWLLISYVRDHKLLDLLVSMLTISPSIRLAACDALLVLVARRIKPEERDILLHFIDLAPAIQAALMAAGPSLIDNVVQEDVYAFQKRVAMVFATFGTYQLSTKAGKVPTNLAAFLSTLVQLYSHESFLLASFVVPLWLSLFKHPDVPARADFAAVHMDLLKISVPKLLKVGDPELNNSPVCAYSSIDFDTSSEFRKFFAIYRRRVMELVHACMLADPIASFGFARSMIEDLTTVQGPALSKQTTKMTTLSHLYLLWEGRLCFFEAMMSGISLSSPPLVAFAPTIIPILKDILRLIMTDPIKDPLIIIRRFAGLQAFPPLFVVDAELLPLVMQIVVSTVTYTAPGEAPIVSSSWRVSQESLSVRRKACSTLVRFSRDMATAMLPFLDATVGHVSNFIAENRVTDGEKSLLLEAILVISLASPSAQVQSSVLTQLFEPLIAEIRSGLTTAMVASRSAFLDAIGVVALNQQAIQSQTPPRPETHIRPDLQPTLADRASNRRKLQYVLNMLFVLIRRLNEHSRRQRLAPNTPHHPCDTYVREALPLALATITMVHSMWEPSFWNGLSSTLQTITDVTTHERIAFTGGEGDDVEDDEGFAVGTDTFGKQLNTIKMFAFNIRIICYQLLGQYCLSGAPFYEIPDLANHILQSVFASVIRVEMRHWRPLLTHFVRYLILACPPAQFNATLLPILPALFTFLNNKLNAEWQAFDTSQNGTDNADEAQSTATTTEADTIMAMIAEKALRDATRSISETLTMVFVSKQSADKIVHNEKDGDGEDPTAGDAAGTMMMESTTDNLASLVDFLLSNQIIAEPLLLTIVSAMTWHDTITCRRCVSVCDVVVTWSTAHANRFAAFIGRDMMVTGLKALHDGYHEDCHDAIFALLTRIYHDIRPHDTAPIDVLLSIPNANLQALQAFDEELMKQTSEKKRRQLFRKYLADFTGKAIGQWFRSRVNILTLPEKLFIHQPANGFASMEGREEEEHGRDGVTLIQLFELAAKPSK